MANRSQNSPAEFIGNSAANHSLTQAALKTTATKITVPQQYADHQSPHLPNGKEADPSQAGSDHLPGDRLSGDSQDSNSYVKGSKPIHKLNRQDRDVKPSHLRDRPRPWLAAFENDRFR